MLPRQGFQAACNGTQVTGGYLHTASHAFPFSNSGNAPVCFAMVQVKFSADGNFLYTGARKDPEIMCWDVRYTSEVVYTLQRDTADTNQRIQFDIEPVGRHLATGECACT